MSLSGGLNQHRLALTTALATHLKKPMMSLVSVLVIGLALSLPAALYHLLADLSTLNGHVRAEPELALYMQPEATAEDSRAVAAKLAGLAGVAEHRFVSRDDALRDLKSTSDLSDVLAGMERNPLPDAFIIRAVNADPENLERLRREMGAWPRVDKIRLDSDWARKLAAIIEFGRDAALGVAVVLGAALLFVIGNTIRLQVLGAREEIEVSRLIGAPNSFIRRPFLYYGALQGALGALVAGALVALMVRLLNHGAADLMRLYGSDFHLRWPAPQDLALLVAAAAVLGWLAAWISVTLYLRQIRPR